MICGIPVARIDDPRGLPVEEQLSILVRLAWLRIDDGMLPCYNVSFINQANQQQSKNSSSPRPQ